MRRDKGIFRQPPIEHLAELHEAAAAALPSRALKRYRLIDEGFWRWTQLSSSFARKYADNVDVKLARSLMKIESHKYAPRAPNDGAWRGRTFVHILEELLDSRKRGLLDLGCGPCLFAQKAQDCGFQVTAVDARSERVPPSDVLGSITFIQEDVRKFDTSGFDIVCMLGLLYHLELKDQLTLLQNCRESVVVVDTQFCEESSAEIGSAPWQSMLVQEEGYKGVLYPESDNVMSGWGNESSFWHTEESLLRMFESCGFEKITRVIPQYSSKYGPRGFFLLNGT